MIQLHIDAGAQAISWEEFCETKPAFSIALDGYVRGGPRFAPRVTVPHAFGAYANFNHHEDVDRLSTRATCAQVLMAIRQGFFETFKNGTKDTIHVYVNDCDQDVCLSVFLLRHAVLSGAIVSPILNRLMFMEDMLDTTAGAYPFPVGMEILEELAWIFEAYTTFRMTGGLERQDRTEFANIIELVERRIERYLHGRGERKELEVDYDVVGGGKGWTMVEEKGAQARTAMFGNGIRAFVSVRNGLNGRYHYSVGRMSVFVPFDVQKILSALSEAEGSEEFRWGGANTIGGSPRVIGSRLTPKEVTDIINALLD